MSSTHTHVIDGKTVTYDNKTCPFCNPSATQTQTVGKQPTAYTKGRTVVLKFSGASLLTATFWTKNKIFLVSMSQIARDQAGKTVRGTDGKPIWQKITRRAPVEVMRDFVYQLSVQVKDAEGALSAPPRS